MKERILGYVEDLVSDFLYYHRKEDEDLPVGAIEQAIDDGIITVDEIAQAFKDKIVENTTPSEDDEEDWEEC